MEIDAVMEVVSAVAPVFVLIGLGLLARGSRWLTREADESLLKLTIRLLYPCFIFEKVLAEPGLSELSVLLWPVSAGFTSIMIGFGVSFVVARLLRIDDKGKRRAFIFTAGIFNYGYFAIPVCSAVFGESFVGKLLVFNLGVELAIWGVGVILLGGGAFGIKRLLNPPILALVLALLMNYAGWENYFPEFALGSISMIGACAIPVGLLLIGATTLDLWREQRASSWDWRVAGGGSLVRLLLLPCVMLAVARWTPFPGDVDWLREIFVLQAAMPAGIFAIVIARYYNADANAAAQAMAPTVALCIITLPTWLALGLWFLKT
jgi:predicted permease